MKVEIVKTGVTDHNNVVEVGEVMDYPEADAKRLIEAGYAEAVEEAVDPAEEIRKALDGKYKAGELVEKGKELGMTLAEGITKKDLIAAIIEADKADEFLA